MQTETDISQQQTSLNKKRYVCNLIDLNKDTFGTRCGWNGTEVIFKYIDEGGLIKVCPQCGNIIKGY